MAWVFSWLVMDFAAAEPSVAAEPLRPRGRIGSADCMDAKPRREILNHFITAYVERLLDESLRHRVDFQRDRPNTMSLRVCGSSFELVARFIRREQR